MSSPNADTPRSSDSSAPRHGADGNADDSCGRGAFAGQWYVFEIYCQDFYAAARLAAERGWWLHAWRWRTDDQAPLDPIVTRLGEPESGSP